jgi:hypothetical protein
MIPQSRDEWLTRCTLVAGPSSTRETEPRYRLSLPGRGVSMPRWFRGGVAALAAGFGAGVDCMDYMDRMVF